MTTDFRAGSNIGGYILDSYIGGGSFGAVWRGHDARTNETVAVKLLTGALSSSETAAMRADVELLAASAASRSEHVVHVLGGGVDPVPHIVMEYVEGSDLSATLKERGKLTAEDTIEVGEAISDALGALNEAGIIHRDIKPANVMMTTTGDIKLADFGIAKIVGYETMTMTGQAAMTMAYAAPEIWDDSSAFGRPSHKSDLYAMGVLLFQCLTGETPFRGNYGALYKAHMERTPDIKVLPPETPPSLRNLIQLCLEKKQADRPKDAVECLHMLDRAKSELSGAANSANEPKQFGPWVKETPHPSQPWAWYCHHESKDLRATVEVHFAETLEYGALLRRALGANPKLVAFGAERLIETNRLLLHPNESWNSPPSGRFQFWIAREDREVAPVSLVTAAILTPAVASIAALIEGAANENISLSIRDELSVLDGGGVYMRRPGLDPTPTDMPYEALDLVRNLPLDAEASAIVAPAASFEALADGLDGVDDGATIYTGRSDSTVLVGRSDSTVIVGRGAPPAVEVCPNCQTPSVPGQAYCGNCGYSAAPAAPASIPARTPAALASSAAAAVAATGAFMTLTRSTAKSTSAWYELNINNPSPVPASFRLNAMDHDNRLAFSLPPEVKVGAGATERIRLHIEARKSRMFGGKRVTPFIVVASGSGGSGNQPPLTTEGEFEDLPSKMPLFAGVGVLGVAAMAAVGVMAMGGGKDNTSDKPFAFGQTPIAATATVAAPTATATATPIPPTPTLTPVPQVVDEPPPPPPPPEANRANCNAIRGTPYQSKTEEEWWAANCTSTNPPPTAPTATRTPVPSNPGGGGGGGTTPPPPPPPPPAATATPVPVKVTVPAQKLSALVGLQITGGHGSTHRVGEQLQLCYTSKAGQRIRVYDTATPGTLMRSGVDDGKGECFSVAVTLPLGADSIRIDALNAAGSAVTDYAQLSIVVTQ